MTEHRATTVIQLKHFPFKTFAELKTATQDGAATVSVHSGVPLQWVRVEGPCSGTNAKLSTMQKAHIFFLSYSPYIAGLAFFINIIITRRWALLLSLPFLFIGFTLFFHDPARHSFHDAKAVQRARKISLTRHGLITITLIGLVWGLLGGIPWLTALTLTLVVICFAQRAVNHKSIDWLTQAVWEQEELFCLLWDSGALNVRLSNGNSYLVDCKKEDGQYSYYKVALADNVFQQRSALEYALLGNMTEKEFEGETIFDARLAEIKLNSGLWMVELTRGDRGRS